MKAISPLLPLRVQSVPGLGPFAAGLPVSPPHFFSIYCSIKAAGAKQIS